MTALPSSVCSHVVSAPTSGTCVAQNLYQLMPCASLILFTLTPRRWIAHQAVRSVRVLPPPSWTNRTASSPSMPPPSSSGRASREGWLVVLAGRHPGASRCRPPLSSHPEGGFLSCTEKTGVSRKSPWTIRPWWNSFRQHPGEHPGRHAGSASRVRVPWRRADRPSIAEDKGQTPVGWTKSVPCPPSLPSSPFGTTHKHPLHTDCGQATYRERN